MWPGKIYTVYTVYICLAISALQGLNVWQYGPSQVCLVYFFFVVFFVLLAFSVFLDDVLMCCYVVCLPALPEWSPGLLLDVHTILNCLNSTCAMSLFCGSSSSLLYRLERITDLRFESLFSMTVVKIISVCWRGVNSFPEVGGKKKEKEKVVNHNKLSTSASKQK